MTTRTATPVNAADGAVRIVFFGTPRSGKTTLLDAFQKSSSTDAETEPVELRHADRADPVRRELVTRMILVDLPDRYSGATAALLLDCDGEACARLMNQPEELRRRQARGAIADAIRNADALVFAVEAKSDSAEIEAQFDTFKTFLDTLRTSRSFDREVGGWPVFLTLTKCDKLHAPGMLVSTWLLRVDEELRGLEASFARYLAADETLSTDFDLFSFGSLQLYGRATSANLPAELRDPAYDLADGTHNIERLVEDALAAASDFRIRSRAARRRLQWTATGVVALVAFFALLGTTLLFLGEASPIDRLNARVRLLKKQNEPAAERLSEANRPRRERELRSIQSSSEFERLPPESQQFISDQLREIEAYVAYKAEFAPPQFSPADVRTQSAFQQLERELDTKLMPPAEFAEAWRETELARLRLKWTDDLRLLAENDDRAQAWYRRLIAAATDLIVRSQQPDWRGQVRRLIRDSQEPDFISVNAAERANFPIPGSAALPIPRGEPLTFGVVERFERTDFARRDWELAERRMLDLLDLSDALGATVDPEFQPSPSEPTALLQLPEPTSALDSLSLAKERLAALMKRYPRAAAGTAYWLPAQYPEPLQQELNRRLQTALDTGTRHLRFVLNAELKLDGRADSPSDWQRLVSGSNAWIDRPEIRSWGRLLQLLRSWAESTSDTPDPVADLGEFLKKETFRIPITAVDLYLPNSLRVEVLTPDGNWKWIGATQTLTLKPTGEIRADTNGAWHRFALAIPLTPFEYKPGEKFAAELPFKGGGAYALKWTRSRTQSFAFEKLFLDPDLEKLAAGEKPQRTSGIRVQIAPEKSGGWIPRLLPDVLGVN